MLATATKHILGIVVVAAIAGLLVAGLALPVVGTTSIAARSTVESFTSLPADFEATPQAQRSVIYDADGNELAVFFDEYRVYKPLDEIADVMEQAMIAIEDARFYDHGPIDLQGTTRALITNVSSGSVEQGGSTLTQQYVKNVLVSQAETEEDIAAAIEASYGRKLRELRLAMAAEEQLTKDQILERYLNIAYFGGGAYGVEAAAQRYYSVSAADLTLNQAATLAGLVQSPSRHDPEQYPERAQARRDTVLAAMVNETGDITAEQADEVRAKGLELNPSPTTNGCIASYAPFFCDYVFREMLDWEALGATVDERERTVRRGGLTITTTLRRDEQLAADRAVRDFVAPTDDAIAAVATVEPGTGHITAMTHSRDYGSGDGATFVNYVADFDRGGSRGFQNGSTMKTFVLAAAISQGIPLNTRIVSPSTFTHTGPMRTCEGAVSDTWEIKNFGNASGTFDLWTGTSSSVNTFYAQLEGRTGICEPATIAEKAGMTTAEGDPLLQVKSFVLGSNEVSPLAMAESYAMFAARGTHCESIAITSITTPNGTELPVPAANCAQVIDQGVADGVTAVLRSTIDGPDPGRTGRAMSLGRPAAGKSGTTDEAKSLWFVGYVPQRTTAVAVSDPEAPTSLNGVTLNGVFFPQAFSSRIPGPIWKAVMDGIVADLPVKEFAEADPSAVAGVSATIPDVRGLPGSQAVATLQAAGFEAYVAAQVNSSVPQGLVVGTDPGIGASFPSGNTVRVFTSTGWVPPPPPPAPAPAPQPDEPDVVVEPSEPEPQQPEQGDSGGDDSGGDDSGGDDSGGDSGGDDG